MSLPGQGKVIREAAGAGDEGDVLYTGRGLGLAEASACGRGRASIGFQFCFRSTTCPLRSNSSIAERL